MRINLQKWCMLFLCSILFQGLVFGGSAKGHRITFQIPAAKMQKVTVGYFYGKEIRSVDSSYFDAKGKVVFAGDTKWPEGLYLLQFGDKTVDFIVSEQQFFIKMDLPNLDSSANVLESPENSIYFGYKKTVFKQKKTMDSLRGLLARDSANAQVRFEIQQAMRKVGDYRRAFFEGHPGSLACKVIKAGIEIKMPNRKAKGLDSTVLANAKDRIFDNLDLSDERLIRTPYIAENIDKYLKFTPLQPDSLIKSCDKILQKMSQNQEIYRFALTYLSSYFETHNKPWMDVLYTYLANSYYLAGKAPWINSTDILNIKANVKRFEPLLTGKKAPAIDFMDTLGRQTPLYSITTPYTILYFWDADCSHCQEITPKMKELYTKIRQYGVEVYAVTIQQVPYSWKEYLIRHQLGWINVWDPINIAQVYATYQIKSTPTIYLLDAEKKIMYKNLEFKELEAIFEKSMRQKNQ